MTLSRKVSARALSVTPALILVGGLAAQIPDDVGDPQTTESGLEYSVLKEGSGDRRPGETDQVRVHYTGWLTDGTQFDSSRERGQPTTFGLNQVIPGWTEGLQLMTVGSRYKFTIPWKIAYGEQGRPPTIPAKADLIFDVELLDLEPEMPAFDAEKATKTESGIEYVVRQKGNGTKFSDGDIYQFDFAVFGQDGKFMDGSWRRNDGVLPPGAVQSIAFLKELAPQMEVGSTWQLKVPSALGGLRNRGGAQENWLITVRPFQKAPEPVPAPEFVLPPDDELTTTKSGLRYKVIKEGDGSRNPRMGESVTCHYSGWLTDGTPFDSSFKRQSPSTFQLGRVIAGWNEGLQLMSPGAQYVFVIPSELGYGENPRPGGVIKPGDTLVFFVQLLSVGG